MSLNSHSLTGLNSIVGKTMARNLYIFSLEFSINNISRIYFYLHSHTLITIMSHIPVYRNAGFYNSAIFLACS